MGVALMLAGCSSGSQASSTPMQTVTATVSATATVTETAELTPVKVPTALKLGASVELSNATVVVQQSKRITRPDGSAMAALVKLCLTGSSASLSWGPWSMADADSGIYPSSSSRYEDDPLPSYPFAEEREFQPGECAKGWVVFEVPESVEISHVVYANSEGDSAIWQV